LFEKLVFLDPRERRAKTDGLVHKENEVLVETMAFRVFRVYRGLLEKRVTKETRETGETEEKLDGLGIQETKVCRE
jgi:hypothetical protein